MVSAVEFNTLHDTIYSVQYTYDVFGDRIEQDVRTPTGLYPTVQRYAYNGDMVWTDLDARNQVETRYLVGAHVDQLLVRESVGGRVGWYLTDDLGSVRDVVNNSGAVLDHIDYDAYGNIAIETNPALGDQYKFVGREYDSTDNLYYIRARYYDPSVGSWATQDPSSFESGSVNIYLYVSSNPTNYIDHSGLSPDPGGFLTNLFGGEQIKTGSALDDQIAANMRDYNQRHPGSLQGRQGPSNNSSAVPEDMFTAGKSNLAAGSIPLGLAPGVTVQESAKRVPGAISDMTNQAIAAGMKRVPGVAAAQNLGRKLGPGGPVTEEGAIAAAQNSSQDMAAQRTIIGLRSLNTPGEQSTAACFPGETPLRTESGPRPIETIYRGERISAFDFSTGDWRLCTVLQTFKIRYTDQIIELIADEETIRATPDHPFWVVAGEGLAARPTVDHLPQIAEGSTLAGRWVLAGHLRAGDELYLIADCTARLASVGQSLYDGFVYNAEIDDLHTYAVGFLGALAHNFQNPVRRFSHTKHHPNSISPEPPNAQQLFDQAIIDKNGVRWAKDANGVIHRFSKPSNDESHWNGSTAGIDPIRLEIIPNYIRRALR